LSDPGENPSGPNTPRAPRISISRLTQPVHANLNPAAHAGRNMRPAEVPGAPASVRHTQLSFPIASIGRIPHHDAIQPSNLMLPPARVLSQSPTSIEYQILGRPQTPVARFWTRTGPTCLACVCLDHRGMLRPSTHFLPEVETAVSSPQLRETRQAYALAQAQSHQREAES
jgi:hypothetical protein